MSATDELRRLLDERGVEWIDDSYAQLWCTVWLGQDGKQWRMTENRSGMLTELKSWHATPEQAIAATLGAGMCHKLPSSGDTVCIVRRHGFDMEFGYWRCSECGCECFEGARYCMNCGRKVVE